ncbi:MAG: nucleotide disphospho-sugar-binding domain-containing protein [Pseudomonadota bacterium]
MFGVSDLKCQLSDFSPDLIIVDKELHAHIVVALSTGRRVMLSSSMYPSSPALSAPPLHLLQVPGRGLSGTRIAIAGSWAIYLLRKGSRILRRMWRDHGADHMTALSALARQHAVPLHRLRRWSAWQFPWGYRLPTLVLRPAALDLPGKSDAGVHYLGPLIWKQRPEDHNQHCAIEHFRKPSVGKARIYVAFGSRITPDDLFLNRLWKVAARQPNWTMLAVVGSHWTAAQMQAPPANVRIVTWAPQLEMLEHADLAILHGGTAGVMEAVAAHTPMLIYPHELDQAGNASRVVFHHLGRAGTLRDSAQRIEEDINAVLADDTIRLACARMKGRFDNEDPDQIIDDILLDQNVIGNANSLI